jgi:pantoate--beta-alanine ligase
VELTSSPDAFAEALAGEEAAGRRVGLVPTMGALHAGHLSLFAAARRDCDLVAATIFVNPLQFGAAEDFAAYPRDLGRDRRMAEGAGVDLLFAPSFDDLFAAGDPHTSVHVSGLADRLEGASRPGHFDGVATIVTKLFALSGRCHAYFGEKDYQQLAVVRRLVSDLSMRVSVVGCPIVREPDGLALSSRNARLSAAERRAALCLHRALVAGREAIEESGWRDAAKVESAMWDVLAAEPLVTPDYAVVVESPTLEPCAVLAGDVRLLVAAEVGPVRLIDNCPADAA